MPYTKTTWVSGGPPGIDAPNLNNIETGIEKADIQLRNSQLENIGYGVQTGLNVTASATADMFVHVQPGIVYMPDGERYSLSAVTDVAVNAADTTNPRKDIVYVSSIGYVGYIAGTPAATPAEPALPSGAMKLCVVDIPAGDTAIDQTQITDSRTMKKAVAYQADVPKLGTLNTDLNKVKALTLKTDTRSTVLTYTGSQLTKVEENDGSTVVKTTNLTYDSSGNLTQVQEIAGGTTVTTTLTYTNGTLTSVSKAVV